MYSRYTVFKYEPERRDEVLAFWSGPALESIRVRDGWQGTLVLDSEEKAGSLVTATLWDSEESFMSYYDDPVHQLLGSAFKELGLTIVDRDTMRAVVHAVPAGSILRVTRARVREDYRATVEEYWRGVAGPLFRQQPGCLRADALWGPDEDQFTLMIVWTTEDEALTFLSSEAHMQFGQVMSGWDVEVYERTNLRCIA